LDTSGEVHYPGPRERTFKAKVNIPLQHFGFIWVENFRNSRSRFKVNGKNGNGKNGNGKLGNGKLGNGKKGNG